MSAHLADILQSETCEEEEEDADKDGGESPRKRIRRKAPSRYKDDVWITNFNAAKIGGRRKNSDSSSEASGTEFRLEMLEWDNRALNWHTPNNP